MIVYDTQGDLLSVTKRTYYFNGWVIGTVLKIPLQNSEFV